MPPGTCRPERPRAGFSLVRNGRNSALRTRRLRMEPLEERNLLAWMTGDNLSAGAQLTTFTLALATTAEFTQAAGGTAATKAILGDYVSGLNAIYEAELAVRFQLHPQNDKLVFTNAATDGYNNGSASALVNENPGVTNSALNGDPNNDAGYDFGHVLGIGSDGGSGGIGGKARGATDLATADVSPGAIQLVAHELAHQMGANHTFNGASGVCGQTRSSATAVEPGSGSTILAYQGLCESDDLPKLAGDGAYFHAVSFDEIIRTLASTLSHLGTKTATGNSLPTVSAGSDRTIPAFTPFTLTAAANDLDAADRLTFTWEQIDAGTPTGISVPVANAQDAVGPLFRSFAPASDPSRSFPRIQDLVANTPGIQNKNEHLPTQNRELNFRVTARDNHLFNGRTVSGVRSDDVKLTVVNTGAPFRVTTLNAGNQPLIGGSQQMVSWDVAGTTTSGINTTRIDILLSIDGGLTFPLQLASATDNDGSELITIPNVEIAKARIKVQADRTQNLFFDMNDSDFRVVQDANLVGGVLVAESGGSTKVAEGLFVNTGLPVTDSYTVALTQPATSEVEITITADSQSMVSLDGNGFAATQTLTISAGDATPKTVIVKSIDDLLVEGVHTSTVRHAVTRSADPNYRPQILTGDVLTPVVVKISDDESPPVVGAELDIGDGPATVPEHWTRITTPFGINVSDMVRENGDPTSVDLAISVANSSDGGGWSFRTTDPGTIPQHSPDIGLVGDSFYWKNSSVTVTWSDLKPSTRYQVYVFAASEANIGTEFPINQRVTIRGSGVDDPAPFHQDGAGKITGTGGVKRLHLLVNQNVGSSSRPLEQYGLIVTSTAEGRIVAQVDPIAGGHAVLSALAIQEVLQPAPGFIVTETAGQTEVTEGGANDTLTVVLNSQPSSNVVLNLSSSNPAEATIDKSTLIFTPGNWNVIQTITVAGVQDGRVDGNQSVVVTIAADASNTDPRYAGLAAKTVNVRVLDSDRAKPWQNPVIRFDASGDGIVAPNDALRVINELNEPIHRNAFGRLPEHRPPGASFYDVNGDGFATSNDVLQVINFLNEQPNTVVAVSAAEGEWARRTFSSAIDRIWADLAAAWLAWNRR